MLRCKRKNCQYRSKISGNTAYCDYIGYTGKPRGCDPENCNKYEPKTAKRPNQNLMVSTDPDHILAFQNGFGMYTNS